MNDSVYIEIVEAVADVEDVDPTELDYQLQDYIPPEAITQLASHDIASWTLSFELPKHNVTVTSDGLILVNGDIITSWT